MTTDEEQQQQQQQQKRESHQDQDVNLDLTIGLALTQTSSANSAESRLQQPVSSCQLFGSVLTRPVCLCWQLDGERRELCRNCQNQNQNQNQSSKSNHSK
jgi:myb proto-oncogene protein